MFIFYYNVSTNGPLFNAQRTKRILYYQQLGVASISIECLTPCLKKFWLITDTSSTELDKSSFATLLEAKYSCPFLSIKTSIRALIRTTRSSFAGIVIIRKLKHNDYEDKKADQKFSLQDMRFSFQEFSH